MLSYIQTNNHFQNEFQKDFLNDSEYFLKNKSKGPKVPRY